MNKIDFKIICDSREKENLNILKTFEKHNIAYEVRALPIGDYIIQTLNGYVAPVIIERKKNINEIIGNILQKPNTGEEVNRFEKELIRASKSPNKLIVLIEELDGYEKMLKGNYRSKVHPNAITGKLFSLKARYGFELVFIDPKYSASFIHKTLYYDLREKLK